MQIILLERVRNLGDLGDTVRVKPGYARNFLIPHGKAIPATAANVKQFEERRAELEQANAAALEQARARAEKIDGATLQLAMKAREEGKLFGSVGPVDIEHAAKEAGFELSRSEVLMPDGPIKTVGDFTLELALHPEVQAKITVSVLAEA
jgi:large subunit ribosomal protein L9